MNLRLPRRERFIFWVFYDNSHINSEQDKFLQFRDYPAITGTTEGGILWLCTVSHLQSSLKPRELNHSVEIASNCTEATSEEIWINPENDNIGILLAISNCH